MLARRKKKPDSLVSRPASDRYPSGQKRESIAPALVYRMREHGIKLGMDPRLGTVLGVMGLHKELTDAEVAAGFKVAEIVGRYDRMKGIPRRHAASPSYQRGFGAGDIDEARMTTDEVKAHARHVRRAVKAHEALMALFRNDRERDIVIMVCCDNEHVNPMLRQTLAASLHYLAEQWDMVQKAKPKPKEADGTMKPSDVLLLATSCADALERWFEVEAKGTPPASIIFEVVDKPTFSRERGITASNGKVSHTVLIQRRGANPVLLDAALRAQALNKGWLEADAETGEVE